MRPSHARTLVIVAALVLLGAVSALIWWPHPEPRADLIVSAASTAPSTTTTTAPPSPVTLPPAATTQPPSIPGRLSIPALGVDAPVVPVGLEADGSMELPPAEDVGWYEPGVRPGSPEGSAVLAAHVDFGGKRGAFFDLRSLQTGAEVVVTSPDGGSQRFLVTDRAQYDKDTVPLDELFRSTGRPTLTLITCGGAFDRRVGHYEDNIVVRAARIG